MTVKYLALCVQIKAAPSLASLGVSAAGGRHTPANRLCQRHEAPSYCLGILSRDRLAGGIVRAGVVGGVRYWLI